MNCAVVVGVSLFVQNAGYVDGQSGFFQTFTACGVFGRFARFDLAFVAGGLRLGRQNYRSVMLGE